MKTLPGALSKLATALPVIARADINHWDFANAKIATDARLVADQLNP